MIMSKKQEILNELQKFVSGVSTFANRSHRGHAPAGHPQLLKCSLTLLAELPAARNVRFFLVLVDFFINFI